MPVATGKHQEEAARKLMAAPGDKSQFVQNQPYDESVEVSDGEEIASTNPSPRLSSVGNGYHAQQQQSQGSHLNQKQQPQGRGGDHGGGGRRRSGGMFDDEEEESQESDSEDGEEEDGPGAENTKIIRGYDPAEFDHLQVSSEIKDMFKYITRYTPQTTPLDCKLAPFIPDFIPAIGDIDAFLKVARPDSRTERLGLTVLDEPTTKQSDPNVLDLQLRQLTKQPMNKPMTVHSISDPENNPKPLDSWIENIRDVHRERPPTNVHYTKNMPDIDALMQEWPPEFEDVLKQVGLPTADLDSSLPQFVDIICSLLDIPVYSSRIQSLHVLFTLYMEFKDSQHFKKDPTSTSRSPEPAAGTTDNAVLPT